MSTPKLPLHRGLHYRRVESDRRHQGVTLETAFADEWERENRRMPGTNYGWGILQDLMYGFWDSRRCVLGGGFGVSIFRPEKWARFVIRRRDAVIAATVVQWFGSNCGFAFLEVALKNAGYEVMTKERADDLRARARRGAA